MAHTEAFTVATPFTDYLKVRCGCSLGLWGIRPDQLIEARLLVHIADLEKCLEEYLQYLKIDGLRSFRSDNPALGGAMGLTVMNVAGKSGHASQEQSLSTSRTISGKSNTSLLLRNLRATCSAIFPLT